MLSNLDDRMKMKVIDGKSIANKLKRAISLDVEDFRRQIGITPGIAVVIVGNNPASEVYVKTKQKQAFEVRMNSYKIALPLDVLEDRLLFEIEKLNKNPNVHGILVQLPLPKHISEHKVINTILPDKDVDGFTIENAGRLSIGMIDGTLIPCTPMGCVLLLKDVFGDNLCGKDVLVIGASNIVGKPLAYLLLYEKCTVTIAHSKTLDLKTKCKNADIIISATGITSLIKPDMIKNGTTIIDVGITRITDPSGNIQIVGDVDFHGCIKKAFAITPVPGGVGPMTIACLLKNTIICARRLHK